VPAAPPAAPGASNGSGTRAYQELVRIFSEELKLPAARFDGAKRFEDYGADSVLIASVVRRIDHLVSESFDPALILENPTLDTLAAALTHSHPDRFVDSAREPAGTRPPRAADFALAAAMPHGGNGSRNSTGEPIAIVGLGCRLPGGDDPESFWRMLAAGECPVREVDPARWDPAVYYSPEGGPGRTNSKWGGFLDDIDLFDPGYFGIDDAMALAMDPLQRLFLEVSTLTTHDAGYRREELAGKRVGVYAGSRSANYAERVPIPDRHTILGVGQNFVAARISDYFDWHAANMVIDSACSSSLVALHLACQALRAGEVDFALAGGVEVLLDEMPYLSLGAAGVLSPQGRCHTFDVRADGFVPGEGAAAMLLRRLDDAVRAGDRIHAVIQGSAVGNDGHTMGITTPNMRAQIEVIGAALDAAGRSPDQVGYLEAHGTGTMIGDPIELKALATVLGNRPPQVGRCAVGSVKTNIGHLLSAAGVAGALKTVLAVRQGLLPPSLHCPNLNPRFAFEDSPLQVNRELNPFPTGAGSLRLAGVSAFGFGGTNAHLIVEQADPNYHATRAALPPPRFAKRSFLLPKQPVTTTAVPTSPAPTVIRQAPQRIVPILRLEPLS
jgi:acyl transferase domain-containing protein